MKTLLTVLAGANLIALNLFLFLGIPNVEAGESRTAIALIVLYSAGFVGSAIGSLAYRK